MELSEITARETNCSLGPNRHLIGKHARQQLNTPALILDIAEFEGNVASMAAYAKTAGISLRPHVKCHKSINIAKQQIKAGAIGISCATLGEAETMGAAGVDNILLTSPVTTPEKIKRFQVLSQNLKWIAVVIDNIQNARALSDVAEHNKQTFNILIDVDPGMHRTGVASEQDAVNLAIACASLRGLHYEGLQCYAGMAQHVESYEVRKEYSLSSVGNLKTIKADLKKRGLTTNIVTGSGTGTFDIDTNSGLFTELQVGSYIFMDSQYNRLQHADDRPVFQQSLFVQAAVCSANHEGFVTVDAGLKQFSLDAGIPKITGKHGAESEFLFMGDEHGKVTPPSHQSPLRLGDRVEFIVPHCDPTVNLYNQIHCVRGDILEDIWPVDARGK